MYNVITLGTYGMFFSQTLDRTLDAVQSKAVQLNESETVKNIKSSTVGSFQDTLQMISKGWEKSVDTVLHGVYIVIYIIECTRLIHFNLYFVYSYIHLYIYLF